MKNLFLFLILIGLFISMNAQSPRFAPGYPTQGMMDMPMGKGKVEVYDALLQTDGKPVICGSIRREVLVNNPSRFRYANRNYLVVRHLENGDPDSTFGKAGIVSIDHRDNSEFFFDLELDDLGNIFLLGEGDDNYYVVKLLPNGSLDPGFGNEGFLLIYEKDKSGKIRDMLIKPDGKMIFCGTEFEDFFLFQFLANGTLDPDFGDTGLVHTSLNQLGLGDDAVALALQTNGRILVAGVSDIIPTVLAYTPSGDRDLSFNQVGYVQLQEPFHNARFEHIHIYSDQSFIAVGGQTAPLRKGIFAAFGPDGQVDSTRFGTHVLKPNTNEELTLRSFAVSPTGDIFYQSYYNKKFLLTKLTPGGQLDSTFGFAGQTIFTLENLDCFGNNVMLQPSGKILMSGSCPPAYSLVCLDSMGNFDPTFQQTGFTVRNVSDGGTTIWNLHELADNSLIATGHRFGLTISRLTGSQDMAPQGVLWKFDSAGKVMDHFSLPFDPIGRIYTDLKETTSGDFIISGHGTSLPFFDVNQPSFVIKTDSDGQLDPTFGNQGTVFLQDALAFSTIHPVQALQLHLEEDNNIYVFCNALSEIQGSMSVNQASMLIRLLPNGILDQGFHSQGYVLPFGTNEFPKIQDVLPMPDGSLLFGGYQTQYPNIETGFRLAQVFKDGTIKTYGRTRGESGVSFSPVNFIAGGKLALTPNADIQQGGSVNGKFTLLQYTSQGILDTDFADNGISTVASPLGNIIFSDMDQAPNGDILMLGYVDNQREGRYDALITCFDVYGFLKTDFGQAGLFHFNLGTDYNYAEAIQVDSSGNFWVSGSAGGEAFTMRFLSELHLKDPTTMPPNSAEKPIVYPNPIKSTTKIRFTLKDEQHVKIAMLDLQGRKIKDFFDGQLLAGSRVQLLEMPDGITPGYYILHVQTGEVSNYVKVQVLPN